MPRACLWAIRWGSTRWPAGSRRPSRARAGRATSAIKLASRDPAGVDVADVLHAQRVASLTCTSCAAQPASTDPDGPEALAWSLVQGYGLRARSRVRFIDHAAGRLAAHPRRDGARYRATSPARAPPESRRGRRRNPREQLSAGRCSAGTRLDGPSTGAHQQRPARHLGETTRAPARGIRLCSGCWPSLRRRVMIVPADAGGLSGFGSRASLTRRRPARGNGTERDRQGGAGEHRCGGRADLAHGGLGRRS